MATDCFKGIDLIHLPHPEQLTPEQKRAIWEQAVLDAAQGKCSNCGGTDRVRVQMIVPAEAGGQLVVTNGATLCRTCDMAAEAVKRGNASDGPARRPLNFWVSRSLYDRLQEGIKHHAAFDSMAGLVRYLMSKYVADESRFDDLEQYQEDGTEVKINVWIDNDTYETFKVLINKRGMTVTDAVKALIRMYEAQAEVLIVKR